MSSTENEIGRPGGVAGSFWGWLNKRFPPSRF
jgi:hypothetical protein